MKWYDDVLGGRTRFTKEREHHITSAHPEMEDQLSRIEEVLAHPEYVIESKRTPPLIYIIDITVQRKLGGNIYV